jgi:rare lipoprotein A
LLPLLAGPVVPVDVPVSQSVEPAALVHLKLRLRREALDVLDGHTATFTGTLRPVLGGHTTTATGSLRSPLAGRPVELQRRSRHGWRTIARSSTGARGRFELRYTPHRLLAEHVRVLFPGDPSASRVARTAGTLRVYRLVAASWYGGGGGLACGGQLTSSTMGVANKTLPCGTLVTLRYGGRTVRVPVVDRGPYVAGREFDLTEATKRALGFEGVGEVWSTR